MFQQVVLFHGIRKLIKAIRCRGSIVFGVGGSSTTERQQRRDSNTAGRLLSAVFAKTQNKNTNTRDSNTGRLLSAVFAKIQIEIQIELQIQIQETAPLQCTAGRLLSAASGCFCCHRQKLVHDQSPDCSTTDISATK